MKKIVISFILITIISCNNATNNQVENNETTTETTQNEVVNNENTITPNEAVNNQTTAEKPQIKNDPSKMPEIKFDKLEQDFGQITEGDVVEYTFKFKNTGKGPLIISNVTSSCGCTTPKWTNDPIMPGGTGELPVKFNSAGKGGKDGARVEKSVNVFTNCAEGTTVLKVVAIVKSK